MEYLFIRILEACNAGCWFCEFAHSNDEFRMSRSEYEKVVDECVKEGIKYIRFTGGEPLLHTDIDYFVKYANQHGIKTSIITNGFLLTKKIDQLVKNGLDQIIVSVDEIFESHDNIRGLDGLFENILKGIKKSKKLGIHVRINTVCGPHNFKSMGKLQDIIIDLGVDFWELSALKSEEKIVYNNMIHEIEEVVSQIYDVNKKLIPYGKKWCGDTFEERDNYFKNSIPPRVNGLCHMTSRVRYYDAKNRNLFVCSLLPHRLLDNFNYRHFTKEERFMLNDKKTNDIADKYKKYGCLVCTGCSSTAAYLGEKKLGYLSQEWEY